jgi:competence protein ComEC
MPTSAVRALIMFILSMGAVLAGRTSDIRTSTAVAAFLMLAANPSYIYEAGFLLSFTAVLGIGFVYPSVRVITLYVLGRDRIRRLHRSNRRLLRAVMALLRTLLFSLALQTAIVPLTMWYYYQLPTYGIIVNLLVIPLAGALLTGSLVTGAAGNIALGAAGNGIGMAVSHAADGVCRISAKFTSAILSLYDLVTERTNELPGGLIITGRPELWQMIVYYTILTAVVTAGYILAGKERRLKRAAAGQRGALRYNSVEGLSAGRNGMIRYLRLRSAVLLGLLLTGTVILFIRTEPEYEISALYVGQGQCIVMHGNKIPTVIYDCGSTDVKEIGKYTVVPFLKYCGISSVDTVFLSHLDTDHVSGLIEILNMKASGVKIKRIVIPKGRSQQSSENYSLLLEAASVRGVPVYEMDRNDTVQWKRLTAECLSPCDGGERYADMNEGSLVLSMVYDKGKDRQRSINKNLLSEESKPAKDFRVLLTGDISCAVEDELAGNLTGKYDWLQIAHHGSRSAANEEFIKTVSPYIAVISAGIDNRYGHPHEETMDILKKHSDMITYITAEGGEIDCRVEERRGGIACYTGRFME